MMELVCLWEEEETPEAFLSAMGGYMEKAAVSVSQEDSSHKNLTLLTSWPQTFSYLNSEKYVSIYAT